MNRAEYILQLLDEEIKFVRSKGREEHDEIHHQLNAHKNGSSTLSPHLHKYLQHISHYKNYKKALSSSSTETYSHHNIDRVDNTDASTHGSFKELHPLKKGRVEHVYKTGRVSMPIIVRHKKSGHEHLLAGNTRLTYGIQKKKIPVKVHVMEY